MKKDDVNFCVFGFQNNTVPLYNNIGGLINTILLVVILVKIA